MIHRGAEPSESRFHRELAPSDSPIQREAVSERSQMTSARSKHHVRQAVSDVVKQTRSRAADAPPLQRPPGRPAEQSVDDGNRHHGSAHGRGDDGSPSLGPMLVTPGGSSNRGEAGQAKL